MVRWCAYESPDEPGERIQLIAPDAQARCGCIRSLRRVALAGVRPCRSIGGIAVWTRVRREHVEIYEAGMYEAACSGNL